MEASAQNYSDRAQEVTSEYLPYPSRGQAFRNPLVYQSPTHPNPVIKASTRRARLYWLVIALIIIFALLLIVAVFSVTVVLKLHSF